MNVFAENLKELRQKCNISRAEMAKFLDITTAAYSFYETAKRQPSLENLYRIAEKLGTSPNELLGYEPNEFERCKALVRDLFEVSYHVAGLDDVITKSQLEELKASGFVYIALVHKELGITSTKGQLRMTKKHFIDLVQQCEESSKKDIPVKFEHVFLTVLDTLRSSEEQLLEITKGTDYEIDSAPPKQPPTDKGNS